MVCSGASWCVLVRLGEIFLISDLIKRSGVEVETDGRTDRSLRADLSNESSEFLPPNTLTPQATSSPPNRQLRMTCYKGGFTRVNMQLEMLAARSMNSPGLGSICWLA
ncbi:hypothetical protein E2C01_045649 [Portunus trituberculatus]|uniref:Uncharacterized protein n=1 Tax=Portunus trituberculatus TaxID=210409 RepID=A0A5B7G310_PORTR|nr:hypothetical protein [Portunus trituberculatus]